MNAIPEKIYKSLKDVICEVFCSDSEDLRKTLFKNFEVLKDPAKNMRQCVAQLKSMKNLSKDMQQEYSARLKFIFE